MLYTFVGENGSLGLENGKKYNIFIDTQEGKVTAYIQKGMKVLICPYDNLKLFINNWRPESIINIDLGNTRGIKRHLDNLGRIVIPMEFRKELNIKRKDKLSIYLLEDGVYITKKYKK